jgi:cytosine/adenosine deaminase-related metal-dependent hydrolase
MFQAMKLFTLLAGVIDGHPTGIGATEALRAATTGGARAVGLAGEVGEIGVGKRADLTLVDLSDIAYLPFNSALRQLVYSECGRGVRTVIVEGRVVLRDGRATGVDENSIAAELEEVMERYRAEFAALHDRHAPVFPHLLDANRRLAAMDLGMDRFIGRAAPSPGKEIPQ